MEAHPPQEVKNELAARACQSHADHQPQIARVLFPNPPSDDAPVRGMIVVRAIVQRSFATDQPKAVAKDAIADVEASDYGQARMNWNTSSQPVMKPPTF